MHLCDPGRGFLGTSGIVGQGIPHATGVAFAAQIRKQGQVVLCFFGDGASKQGAFHESLNLASLWKLPVVYIMENNSYNVATHSEQEDANAADGEPLSVKAKAYSMPGVTVDGTRPAGRVRDGERGRGARPRRRRADAGGIQGLPPVGPRQPHRPARGAAALPRARGDHGLRQPRGVRGRPARRPRAPVPRPPRSSRARSTPRAPTRSPRRSRDEMDAAVQFGLDSPFPEPEAATNFVYA